jgi:SpoVK/Ycf46/Vps4 family AAA+-type ATPase
MTPSQKTNVDISALLRARNTLVWITSREEVRVERAIIEAAGAAKFETRFWDCATGLTASDGKVLANIPNAYSVLERIRDDKARMLYVLRDIPAWFDPQVVRMLRSLARSLPGAPRDEARAIIILTPRGEVPPELAGHATVIDYPLPARDEIAEVLETALGGLPDEFRAAATPTNGLREQAIDAAVGLTAEEASNCYAKSLVTTKRIDPAQVSSEKRRVIAREKVLTWYDPEPRGLDAVGGLELLKDWLKARRSAFSQKARDFGLPEPKGCLLVGVPGGGKSLTAKAIATAWGMPLLRLDLGALRSKYVGESEGNIRKALAVAETVAPCVLWLDEIEKALAGATGAQGDGGVSADALGAVLSWMQERQAPVFVVATANKVSDLPPELLRKGRFDELFFVDLPTPAERKAILRTTLAAFKRSPDGIDEDAVARATQSFTGAEIAAIVPEAMFVAFGEGERAIQTEDLLAAAARVVPLAETAKEQLAELRAWAKGKARPAATPVAEAPRKPRELDL